jgi:hypothetical protein
VNRRRAEPSRPEALPVRGQALVCVTPSEAAGRPAPYSSARPSAAFLAHLIATREQAPQTRERRRAGPGEAAAIYGAVGSGAPLAGGKMSFSS